MPFYYLHAADSGDDPHLDSFEANDAEEAIVLSVLRLERRDMELRSEGATVARIYRDGRLSRAGDVPG